MVIGAGLAGCEAALQCARRGVPVRLVEMRPGKMTEAHETGDVAELVCSNSLKSDEPENAHGLLKAELRILGSVLLECAERARIPGGKALVVDRRRFSAEVRSELERAGVSVEQAEVSSLPPPSPWYRPQCELSDPHQPTADFLPSPLRGEGKGEGEITVVATGPLTSQPMAEALQAMLGAEHLFFYDAIAPIVAAESLDMSRVFAGSRYGAGDSPDDARCKGQDARCKIEGAERKRGDAEKSDVRCEMSDVRSEPTASRESPVAASGYLNCPMSEEEYGRFVDALLAAELHSLHEFEKGVSGKQGTVPRSANVELGAGQSPFSAPTFFEGCLPVEEIARRGRLALAFGPMKPVGLVDPRTGSRSFAVVQLRRENAEGTMYNLVGFQTRLRQGEQERVFRMIPGLEKATFLRFGSIHRNTFLDSPRVLLPTLQARASPDLLVAGQLTGVEGYVESIGAGLVAGINAARLARGEEPVELPRDMMLGSLLRYITASASDSSLECGSAAPALPTPPGKAAASALGTVPIRGQSPAFQPMNANFGLLPPLGKRLRGRDKRRAMAERALEAARLFALRV